VEINENGYQTWSYFSFLTKREPYHDFEKAISLSEK
jgi:hypothetical protein